MLMRLLQAIDFAKERKDDDLWEDLLRYSETRPTFIKGLLENVSTEIDPIRIIRRIRNGLEIPGLKESLIKILQDFNLQTSLMEGCGTILNSDCSELATRLQHAQEGGVPGSGKSPFSEVLVIELNLVQRWRSMPNLSKDTLPNQPGLSAGVSVRPCSTRPLYEWG